MALSFGRVAMGNSVKEYFKVGESFDATVVDKTNPLMSICQPHNLLSTLIYAGDPSFLLGTIVRGEWKVISGNHLKKEKFSTNFRNAISTLNVR